MRYKQALHFIDLIRSKYRYYGVSIRPLEDNISCIDDYLIFGRLGLFVIESIEKPAHAYYIQRVVFPRFVRRVFPPSRGVKVDYSFEGNLALMMKAVPQLYYDVISWPANIR